MKLRGDAKVGEKRTPGNCPALVGCWSGLWDSNPRSQPWEGRMLPLHQARKLLARIRIPDHVLKVNDRCPRLDSNQHAQRAQALNLPRIPFRHGGLKRFPIPLQSTNKYLTAPNHLKVLGFLGCFTRRETWLESVREACRLKAIHKRLSC